MLAQTRSGKQVLSLPDGVEAQVCTPAEGDMVACIGENRKMLLFPLSDVPEMTRGRGVMLQKYKDGGLSDAKVYEKKEGLSWRLGDKTRTETNLRDWIGERAQAAGYAAGLPVGQVYLAPPPSTTMVCGDVASQRAGEDHLVVLRLAARRNGSLATVRESSGSKRHSQPDPSTTFGAMALTRTSGPTREPIPVSG